MVKIFIPLLAYLIFFFFVSNCLIPSPRHPDKNKHPGAEEMFIKITKSYEVRLSYIL